MLCYFTYVSTVSRDLEALRNKNSVWYDDNEGSNFGKYCCCFKTVIYEATSQTICGQDIMFLGAVAKIAKSDF
jgi:hypothetical protein